MTVDRQKFIGGSDAAGILGISPWRTPYQIWLDKTQPAMPENVPPERQRVLDRGKRLEPIVLDMLQAETGLQVARRNERYIDPSVPFLAAEIDAETADGTNIEIKTASAFRAKEWGEENSDEIPLHYAAQAMHGLMVTGRNLCVFGVLIGGDDLRVYRVERDDITIAGMREREVAFWRNHVETLQPPPPASEGDLSIRFAKDAGTSIEASAEIARALDELRALKADEDALAERIEGVRNAVKSYMGENAVLTVKGRRAASWKSQTTRRFDQRVFAQQHADLFDQFLKTVESRVFRIA